jgi:hypothetical protein
MKKEEQELLEAKAELGELLFEEKRCQAVIKQLIPRINEVIIKVQELTTKE